LGLLLAVALVYLVLSGQFGSFLDPLLILCAVPLGLAGVLLTLWLTRTTFNIQSFTGVIFMVGIAVSNSILLVEFANRRLEEGQSPDDAVIEAACIRLRPILMTSLATILGLMPMAIGIGRGSEANVPLARAVLGGITVSTLLVLVLVPMLFSFLQRFKKRGLRGDAAAMILVALALVTAAGSAQAQAPQIKSISYNEAVAYAMKNNPRILAAQAQVEESKADVKIARAPLYPRLTASAMDSSGLGGSSSAIGITGLVNSPYRKDEAIGVDMAWNLYDFGRTTYRTEAAKDRVEVAKAELDRVMFDVRLKLADAYLHCAQFKSLSAVFGDQIDDQQAVSRELAHYVRSGLRTPVELDLVQGTTEGIAAQREETDARKAMAVERLEEAMGASDDAFDCEEDSPAVAYSMGSLSESLASALSKRPEIVASLRQAEAAEAESKAASRDQWPILSAVASGGALSKTSPVEKKEWSAGVGIRVPLFEGFRPQAAEEKAARAHQEAEFRLAAARQAVAREVRSAAAWVTGLGAKGAHLQEQERLVGGAYRLARRRYLDKTGTFTDLRDAQGAYFQVAEQAVATRYARRLAVEQLKLAAGL
ncbi:MAG: efflux RND transporter permease subunit, partial [Elusimicrobia bacterium]|nr:efflux RND transporter permease subunit [Elusimicrobiota bacterium]